jgi:predicted nucleic acid-binding protein
VTFYLDSSAILRLVLREPGGLEELATSKRRVSSELLVVETLRTLDRLVRQQRLRADELPARRERVFAWLESVDLVLLQRPILARASEPFATPLGTLDALHLATLLLWRDANDERPVLATHDRDLAVAARAYGIEVRGV